MKTVFTIIILVVLAIAVSYKITHTKEDVYKTIYINNIKVEDMRDDVPAFRREYTVKVDGRFDLKITAANAYSVGDRLYLGTVTQSDGSYIIFHAESIATDILNKQLAQEVQSYTDQIIEADKKYMKNEAFMFEDKEGTVWIRLQEGVTIAKPHSY